MQVVMILSVRCGSCGAVQEDSMVFNVVNDDERKKVGRAAAQVLEEADMDCCGRRPYILLACTAQH